MGGKFCFLLTPFSQDDNQCDLSKAFWQKEGLPTVIGYMQKGMFMKSFRFPLHNWGTATCPNIFKSWWIWISQAFLLIYSFINFQNTKTWRKRNFVLQAMLLLHYCNVGERYLKSWYPSSSATRPREHINLYWHALSSTPSLRKSQYKEHIFFKNF